MNECLPYLILWDIWEIMLLKRCIKAIIFLLQIVSSKSAIIVMQQNVRIIGLENLLPPNITGTVQQAQRLKMGSASQSLKGVFGQCLRVTRILRIP